MSTTQTQLSIKKRLQSVRSKVNTQHMNLTQYGFPSIQKQERSQMSQSMPRQPSNQIMEGDQQATRQNHIQNSIKIMRQEDKQRDGKNEQSFNNSNFNRISKELSKTRTQFGARNESIGGVQKNIPKKKEELLEPNDMLKGMVEPPKDFQGQPAQIYITTKQNEKWMQKRKVFAKSGNNRQHIEFAKNLFISWDDDGSGVLEADEIIKPLIGLGLSSDSKFAIKILQALDPNTKKSGNCSTEDLRITLKDFIKIFKNDKISEHLVQILKNEYLNQKGLQEMLKPATASQLDTLTPREQINRSNVALTYKCSDTKTMVEIPIDKEYITVHTQYVSNGRESQQSKTYKVKGQTLDLVQEIEAEMQGIEVAQPQKIVQKNQNPSLAQQMEILKNWWKEINHGKYMYELPVDQVCLFMVKKRLAQDKEKALKMIITSGQLGHKKDILSFDEFNRIFCKGIFKEALINITSSLNKMQKQDVSLALKINEFQRNQMLQGLDPKSNQFQQGRQILNSLNEIRDSQDDYRGKDYKTFLDDPLGVKSKQQEEQHRLNMKRDPFNDRIKFIEDIDKAHDSQKPTTLKKKKHTLLEAKQRYLESQEQNETPRKMVTQSEIKIPAVYYEKSREERLKDQNQLLQRFQNLLQMRPQQVPEV